MTKPNVDEALELVEAAQTCLSEAANNLTSSYEETTELWGVLIWLKECAADLHLAAHELGAE